MIPFAFFFFLKNYYLYSSAYNWTALHLFLRIQVDSFLKFEEKMRMFDNWFDFGRGKDSMWKLLSTKM